ncbi:MAG: acyl carrier protein [Lachnospiraceae bacterium]|nr:acyl carrier protein [Lachnospiraceae bacterium]MDD3794716.1 acyl carrier protein [Lachnospiraceae bacterium]
MLEKMKDLLVESTGVEADKITLEASFKDDLGIDSLDMFELVMALEEEFNLEIPTEDLEGMLTVGDVISYIEAHQ